MGIAKLTERYDELAAAAEKLENSLFPNSLSKLQAIYGKAADREAMEEVFADLFRSWKKESRPAASLAVCYRRTDVHMHRYGYRLMLFGEEFYLDPKPLEKIWTLTGFSEMYEADLTVILSELKKCYPRLRPYEEDAVRWQIAEYYHAAAYVLCQDMMSKIMQGIEFAEMDKTDGFLVFFGRYQGAGRILAKL